MEFGSINFAENNFTGVSAKSEERPKGATEEEKEEDEQTKSNDLVVG